MSYNDLVLSHSVAPAHDGSGASVGAVSNDGVRPEAAVAMTTDQRGRYLPAGDIRLDINGLRFVNHTADDGDDDEVDDDDDDTGNDLTESFLARLVSLDLRSNSVSKLDKKVMKKMKNLKILNLSSNNLHFISENAFEENQALLRLYLQVGLKGGASGGC